MTAHAEAAQANPTITVCVLAWNEVKTLASVVVDLTETLRGLGAPFEVVIIDDGSTDGTSEKSDALAQEHAEVRVVHHGTNRGLGPVYRTGFEEARGTYLSFFPADGQFPSELLTRFYPLIERYDMTLGNLPRRTGSIIGAALSRAERIAYRAMFGKMPRLEGVFMMRTSILQDLTLRSEGRGWAIVMELVLRADRAKLRLVGVPITMRPRAAGQSKVNNAKNIIANLRQLASLRAMIARDDAQNRRSAVRE